MTICNMLLLLLLLLLLLFLLLLLLVWPIIWFFRLEGQLTNFSWKLDNNFITISQFKCLLTYNDENKCFLYEWSLFCAWICHLPKSIQLIKPVRFTPLTPIFRIFFQDICFPRTYTSRTCVPLLRGILGGGIQQYFTS